MAVKQSEWSVVAMLEWATEYLQEKGVPDARFSIEWLMADVLGMKRLDLYLYFDRPLSKNELDELRPLVKRRAKHEPLQYITGHTDFLNTNLNVGPEVLIPRPETEQLVEIILKNHSGETLSALDIGTGSGCIAIALKKERPEWKLTAVDKSTDALAVATQNAGKNDTNICFLEFDILSPVKKNGFQEFFNIIVSNPPYVLTEEKEMLEPQVINYEPATALFCESIEKMYKNIIQFSENCLARNGVLYLEIHANQTHKITPLFNNKWQSKLIKDYSGKDRFIHAVHNKTGKR